jgi:4-oxalocrotonate tautomerase
MPFVSIRMIEGRSQQQKDEISKRVSNALSEVLEPPKGDMWIVFEEITARRSLSFARREC